MPRQRSGKLWRHTVGVAMLSLFFAGGLHSSAVAQTQQTRQVMREKLTRTSALLGALVTSNWSVLERESRALDAVTMKPGWEVLQYPEYVRDTRAFNRSVQSLIEASATKDQSVALTAYNALVASCVECHRNVARRRLASR